MKRKFNLLAILLLLAVSFGFLSCKDKEDDTNTNPTTSTDVIKEIYSYYGKTAAQVLPILDAKGWTKSMETSEELTRYSYFNSDSTKKYLINLFNDTVKYIEYVEFESSGFYGSKIEKNTDKFLSLYEKMELSFNSITPSQSKYWGAILADSLQFNQKYQSRDAFISDFHAKKSTLSYASTAFIYGKFYGETNIRVDYQSQHSLISVFFTDITHNFQKKKTLKNFQYLNVNPKEK